jgi:ATP-dependent 26S proteasome regulatory subunit
VQELVEAIVLPIQHKDRFEKLGIRPPKGVLLYGAPGTGKTLLARACAAQTNATFLKLAGPQLVQMFIGDGAKMVRGQCVCVWGGGPGPARALVEVGSGLAAGRLAGLQLVQIFIRDGAKMVRGAAGGLALAGVLVVSNGARG